MYERPIDASEATLRTLDEKFIPVADDRFLYNLQQKTRDIDGLHKFIASLRIAGDYTSKEYERILKLKETYNKEYPTEHKKYFSTAAKLMDKMQSTLSAYKKILEGFRPKKKRGRGIKEKNPMRDQTALFKGPYSQDAFGWETYPDRSVRDLRDALNDYLSIAKKSFDECIGIIEEEAAIRANLDLSYILYTDSFNRSVSTNKKIIEMMKQGNVNPDHDLVKAMEDAEDVRQLIADFFHEYSYADFNYFCACKTISDGRKVGLTDEEVRLFGKDNAAKVIKVRALLDHILELAELRNDVIGWKGKLSGVFVMRLLFWCGWDGTKNVDLLNYITRRCKGKIGVVKMGAVMTEKRKLAYVDNRKKSESQDAFNRDMDDFADAIVGKKEQ